MSEAALILTPWLSGSPPLTSPFGAIRGGLPHTGDDYAMLVGTLLRAPVGGVARSFVDELGGLSIVCACDLKLPSGKTLTSWGFAHLSEVAVGTGDTRVAAGQIVGRSGNTGKHTTGPHLHFVVRVDNQRVAPSSLLGSSPAVASSASALLLVAGLAGAWFLRR